MITKQYQRKKDAIFFIQFKHVKSNLFYEVKLHIHIEKIHTLKKLWRAVTYPVTSG